MLIWPALLGVLLIDMTMTVGETGGALYALPVLLCHREERRNLAFRVATVGTLGLIAGPFLWASGTAVGLAIVGRSLAAIVMWLTATIVESCRRSNAGVAARDERYRRLVEMSPEMILVNKGNRIVEVNATGLRVLGAKTSNEVIGHSPLEFVHADSRHDVESRIAQLTKGPGEVPPLEQRLVGVDGSIATVEVAASSFDDSGELVIQVCGRDVTNERRMKSELQRVEERLERIRQMHLVESRAPGIAHDFVNLLMVVSSVSEILSEADNLTAVQRQAVREIRVLGERATGLFRNLMTVGRAEPVDLELLDVNEVVTEAVVILRHLLHEEIELVIDLDTQPAVTSADRAQLERVLMHLVVNARDAMPSGGTVAIATRNVDLSAADAGARATLDAGAYVALTVHDTGSGIDARTQARIFEPYFTTKLPGKGTGLGLPTVQGIIENYGGAIEVESAPEAGTTLRIYLPRTPA